MNHEPTPNTQLQHGRTGGLQTMAAPEPKGMKSVKHFSAAIVGVAQGGSALCRRYGLGHKLHAQQL